MHIFSTPSRSGSSLCDALAVLLLSMLRRGVSSHHQALAILRNVPPCHLLCKPDVSQLRHYCAMSSPAMPLRCPASLSYSRRCPCFATLDGLNNAHAVQGSPFLSYAIATPAVHYFAGAEQYCLPMPQQGFVMPSPPLSLPFPCFSCLCFALPLRHMSFHRQCCVLLRDADA